MSQVFLVRHGETEWNVQRRIQGHSDSPLTQSGIDQAKQVAARLKNEGITHIIASDLGRTQQTAKLIAEACGCEIIADPRLRELNMGVLEKRQIHTLTAEEEGWRKSLLNGAEDGRIPEGESSRSWKAGCGRRWRARWICRRAAKFCWSVTVLRWDA